MSSPKQSPSLISAAPGDRKTSVDCKPAPSSSQNSKQPEPEPLLSLITTTYPLLASTIGGAASAYRTGKNYSPHLKSGAEYVESCLNPVAKAVGTVSRKTGVEGGVRWIFGIRNKKQQALSDIESGDRGSTKRRKSERNDKESNLSNSTSPQLAADGFDDRRMSISTIDTLPPYDDQKSPAYTEVADEMTSRSCPPGTSPQPWPQRFVVTTSGLGVAMKQESLKSLRFCLKVLRETNSYVGEIIVKLKNVIDEYDRATQKDGEDQVMKDSSCSGAADLNKLLLRMKELKEDIFRVIQRTVQTVSKYAGSALPENARNIVHRQLMSLPGLYQFHYIRETSEGRRGNGSPEALVRDSAHLALLFAKEALQMMTQVGDVLNRTLVSAEEWCETLYRKKNDEQAQSSLNGIIHASTSSTAPSTDSDVKMSG